LSLGQAVDGGLLGALVPSMLIQPLVENAIRHGAAVKPGPARVDLEIRRDGDVIVLEITDTGPGFGAKAAGNGSGIGLANCRARLAGLYGERASLDCSNRPGSGAVVRVRLPFRLAEAAA
ncbi:MAG: ATP-binding protein, partial [Gemmatimonadota bacterium]